MVVISAFWLSKQFFEACAMIALVQVSVKVIKICMKSVSSKSVCNYLVFPGLSSLLQHPSPSAGDSIQSQILKRGVVQGKMSAKEDLKSSCHICLPLGLNVFFVKKDFKNKIWLWGVRSPYVLLLNMSIILELSGLFVCLWGLSNKEKYAGLWFARGIITQVDTVILERLIRGMN